MVNKVNKVIYEKINIFAVVRLSSPVVFWKFLRYNAF